MIETESKLKPLIQVEHVIKRVNNHTLLNDVSFEVPRGDVLGLLGPNGAGKTTLLRLMLGLSTPSAGRILIDGQEYRHAPLDLKRRVAFVPDKINLDPNFTAEQNLLLHGDLFHLPRDLVRARTRDLLAFFDLAGQGGYAIRALSHGMQRKVLLARALISQPEVLILDEPTLGLDPGARRELLEYLRRLNAQGLTLVLTTQSLVTAESVCKRVAILRQGQLVRVARARELVSEIGALDEMWVELESGEEVNVEGLAAALRAVTGVQSVEVAEGQVEVALSDRRVGLPGVLQVLAEQRIPLHALALNRPSFEEAFLKLTEIGSEG